MDQSNPSTWSAGAPYDPLAASSDHDFDSLLNYDHFDITNFGIDFTNETQHHNSNHQLDLVDSLTIPHLQDHLSHSHAQGHHDVSGQVPQQKQDAIGRTPISQPGNDFFPFSLSGFAQQGQQPFSAPQEQVFHSHGTVPPTPNSVEMHGDTARYLEDMETNRAVFGEHYHIRKEDPVRWYRTICGTRLIDLPGDNDARCDAPRPSTRIPRFRIYKSTLQPLDIASATGAE